jgi:hypothetical protein
MLRISVIDSRTERQLVLEGKLIGPWVEDRGAEKGMEDSERRDRGPRVGG